MAKIYQGVTIMDNFRINAPNNDLPQQNNPNLDRQDPDEEPVRPQDLERAESMAVAGAILVAGVFTGIGLTYLHLGDTVNAYEFLADAATFGIGAAILFWVAVNRR
jgi:hypothetical protein